MWRAFFLAIGITLCVLGAECMVLDKAILAVGAPTVPTVASEPVYDEYGFEIEQPATANTQPRTINPPEWAPWSLLSTGAIVLLYSLTRRTRGD